MRRVLVPLDGSERGDQVLTFLDRFLVEARARELLLVRVVCPGEAADAAADRLEATARRARSEGLVVQTLTLVGDDPAAQVLKVADLVRPALVALSTHGQGQSPAKAGSVASRILEGCPVPVLLVGRQALPLDPRPGPSRVLVAFDGSPGADSVLPIVGDLARPSDAEVVLLAVEDGAGPAPDLDVAHDRLRAAGVDRIRVVRARGSVATAMFELAAREPVDLMALGARGRATGEGLGSVARAVAQRCDCPLLIVR